MHYLISKHSIHFDVKFRPNLVTKDDLKMYRVKKVSLHELLIAAVYEVDCTMSLGKNLQISNG